MLTRILDGSSRRKPSAGVGKPLDSGRGVENVIEDPATCFEGVRVGDVDGNLLEVVDDLDGNPPGLIEDPGPILGMMWSHDLLRPVVVGTGRARDVGADEDGHIFLG